MVDVDENLGTAGGTAEGTAEESSQENENDADTSGEEQVADDDNENKDDSARVVGKFFKRFMSLPVIIGLIFGVLLLLLPLFLVAIIFSGADVFGDTFSGISSGISYNNNGGSTPGNSISNGDEFVSTTNNTSYWWPIGGVNSNRYDSGASVSTRITSTFGPRIDPMSGVVIKPHNAIDIAPYEGQLGTINIIAAKDGEVIYPKADSVTNCGNSTQTTGDHNCGNMLGNYVKIKHNDGLVTVYGHMYANTITVKEGDTVKQGQVIGKMGSSGNSTGMHLHFGVFSNNVAINPLEYVSIDNQRPVSGNSSNNNTNTNTNSNSNSNSNSNNSSSNINNNNHNGNNGNVEMVQ